MYELAITPNAEADIKKLFATDPKSASVVMAYLGEIADDQYLLESLSVPDFEEADEKFNVSQVYALQDSGWNVWRLKLFVLEPRKRLLDHRVLYAFDTRKRIYHVLAVMHRDQDYEKDKQLIARIKADYDRLGIYHPPAH